MEIAPNITTKPLIDIKDLVVSFSDKVVLNVENISILESDFITIIGSNGSGKTTLLRALLGLQTFIGDVKKRDDLRVGYLPQVLFFEDSWFPATVLEIIEMGFLKQQKNPKKLQEIIELLDLQDILKQRIGTLSGGQKQRVFFARSLVSSPNLLVLDEPTSSLDPNFKRQVFEIVNKLNREEGVSVLLVTHALESCVNYSNKILYINKKVLFFGKYDDFINSSYLDSYDIHCPVHCP